MMPRIRTIKPEFFTDEDMGECSPMARLLAIGLLCYADCAGRLEWSPAMFAGVLFPHDGQTAADIEALADELSGIGYLLRWEAPRKANGKRGKRYGVIVNFNRHQRMSGSEAQAESKLPPPPDECPEKPDDCGVEILGASSSLPAEADRHAGKERKGKEGKGREQGSIAGLKPARSPSGDMALLIEHYRAEWLAWRGKPTRKTDKVLRGLFKRRIKEYGLEPCKMLLTWAFRSPGAAWLRGEGGDKGTVYIDGDTLWGSKFLGYMAKAEEWDPGEQSFPPNDSLPLPQVADAFVDFHKGLKVMREPSGMWLPDSRKMLDPNLPWRAVLRDVMAGILRRRDAGERVDKYVPEPFLAALRECSHPARPEQQIHLSNILGRLVDEIEGAQ